MKTRTRRPLSSSNPLRFPTDAPRRQHRDPNNTFTWFYCYLRFTPPAARLSAHDKPDQTRPDQTRNTVLHASQAERQAERYRLLPEARKLLPENGRIQNCQQARIDASRPVRAFQAPGGLIYFDNLQTCGKLFCPVCGPRIQWRRRQETVRLAQGAERHGLDVLRVDWTHGHHRDDELEKLLAQQRAAFRAMGAGKAALSQKLKRAGVHYAGMRRALDYVHGDSGHHPHQHGALLLDAGRIEDVTGILKDRWAAATRRAGLSTGGVGVVVAQVDAAGAGYLYKTGERPDAPSQHGRTPHQLLRASAAGDTRAGMLWQEYARAVDGQRLTTTTPGLKAFARLSADGDDEQLAAMPAAPGFMVVEFGRWEGLTADVWASLTETATGHAAD